MVTSKRFIVWCVLCLLSATWAQAQVERWGKNHPYIDDKLCHFGFQLGLVFPSFGVTDADSAVTFNNAIDTLHARVSTPGYGFRVGFVTDIRLCKYLNLRITPGIEFSNRTITYKSASGIPVRNYNGAYNKDIDVLAIPIDIPLFLKFSAEREGNFRPYVIAGGGVSFNVYRDNEKPVKLNLMDYFCQVGFGCNLYFRWFRLCPELSYRIGFANQLCPNAERTNYDENNGFYTNALSRLTNHAICLTFNFE